MQTFSIDLQTEQIQERAHFQEYFVQDDWRVSNRFTISPGLRYTLNFPSTEINGQTAVFNPATQLLDYPGDEPVRPLKKNNFGPRLGLAYRVTDKTLVSTGYGLVWIEMAGITTPFTTPSFPFLQTVTQRALDTVNPAFVLQNGPSVAPIAPTPTAGVGQGVFGVDATLGSGYVQQWNASVQREIDEQHDDRGRVCRFEDHACRHPRHQHQPADGRPARAGQRRSCSAWRTHISASSRARRRSAIRRSRWRSCSSRSRSTRPSASIATTSGRRTTRA